ncbi:uncharacterized protein LOC130766823 isoform X1 [Actinidia eriantha]|uniref:uncharacterized protein LOC130766823 isoform X1 n=1 Tax=Actinidia eriantha TaxID=165200 RepID=UPI00259024CE|nr:uncharacterized protein LOC130766823 isoform X1 [Actinidia eriantha]XP_057479505.1 uncharacterized protein LOC130766823 isoform X1 [Actinidia eriantha]
MMDLMALFLDLVGTIVILVIKPFLLVKTSCIFGVRSFCIVIHTWMELLRTSVAVQVTIIWRLVVWTFALISIPARILTALQREKLLQMHIHELQIELENLMWNRKELEERLQMAINECRMMETMLAEVEDEQDEAIVKIEMLERELQDIKEENLRLKEIQRKGVWSFQSHDDTVKNDDHNNGVAAKYNISYEIQSRKSSLNESSIILQDLLMQKDVWADESISKTELLDFMRAAFEGMGASHAVGPGVISRNLDVDEVLKLQREVAVLQSLFSAVLSFVVGMVIWEAEDPCTPLVVALFIVVAVSLKSVVQFFSTIKNKPASNAVALLSFNCCIRGAVSYPTLPRIAHMLTPMALSFSKWTVSWIGFTS